MVCSITDLRDPYIHVVYKKNRFEGPPPPPHSVRKIMSYGWARIYSMQRSYLFKVCVWGGGGGGYLCSMRKN